MMKTKIAEARKKSGKTQDLVVESLRGLGIKVTKQTYLNWERGVYYPRLNQADALSKIFNVPVNYFFGS